jgi:putative SOS response-associated peptidase YedK
MCGRFVSSSPPDQIAAYFAATLSESLVESPLAPNYNTAPTNDIYAVVETPDGGREVQAFHWGLVPVWAKDIKLGQKMINARAETVATKGAFKPAFKRKRCIIPADGFYEWQKRPGMKAKQPYFIHRLDGEPLAFAGLWETWRDPNLGPDAPVLHSCTIITTSANATMEPIHDRMPVILPPNAWPTWLDRRNQDLVELNGLLVPAPDHLLSLRTVSTEVNNVRNKGADLIEEAEPLPPDSEPATKPAKKQARKATKKAAPPADG